MIPFLFILFSILQVNTEIEKSTKDLPDLNIFLQGVRANLRSDRLLQSQYTYNLKQTKVHPDKEGNPKKIEVDQFEVFPSLDDAYTYMKQTVKDGRPVDPEEIEKQDRAHNKKLRKRAEELEKEGIDERARRLRKGEEEKRKEDMIIDELFRLYAISLVQKEVIEGCPAILLEFHPREGFKPSSRESRILAKLAGQAWFCEEDYQLIRSEVEFIDDVSFGKGLLARLHKGTKAMIQRRRVNNEVWLPAKAYVKGSARIFLFKKIDIYTINEYSDYKKFTVDAFIEYDISGQ